MSKVAVAKRNGKNSSPFNSLSLLDSLDSLDEFYRFPTIASMFPETRVERFNRSNAIDIHEDEKAYYITADLPGYSRDEIELSLEKDTLRIKGSRSKEEKAEDKRWIKKERVESSFERTIKLYDKVTTSKIDAKLENGVLEITLPKNTRETKVKQIAIK